MPGYITGAEQFNPQEQASTKMDFESPFGPVESMTDLMGEEFLYNQPFSNFDSGFPQVDSSLQEQDPSEEAFWPDADQNQEEHVGEASGYDGGNTFVPGTVAGVNHYPEPTALNLITQPYYPPQQPASQAPTINMTQGQLTYAPVPSFQAPTPPNMTPDQLAQYFNDAAMYYFSRAEQLGFYTAGHVIGEVPPTARLPTDKTQTQPQQASSPPPLPKRKTALTKARVLKETLISSGLQRFSKTSPENLKPRTRKILEYDARTVYPNHSPHPSPFPTWGPQNCFAYTLDCELLPGSTFSPSQIHHYLTHHPRGVRLWLQRNPADSKRRYGHSASARCRMVDCPADYHLIGQAQYRVAFDERAPFEKDYDPMHCAMYVHLFCLEKLLDFPLLCKTCDVRAEDRSLPLEPGGRNRMLFSSEPELELAQDFLEACKRGKVPRSYPKDHSHEGSLTHMLAMKKVELEPRRIGEARRERKARSTFDVHLGDLEVENEERGKSRRPQWQTQRKGVDPSSSTASGTRASNAKNKRKRAETDDDSDEEEEVEVVPAPKKVRKSARGNAKATKVVGQKANKRRVVEDESEDEQDESEEEYLPRTKTRTRTVRRTSRL